MLRMQLLGRRFAALTTAATLFALGACSETAPVSVDPVLPGAEPIPTQYRSAAFVMDVSATRKTVRITSPTTSINGPIAGARLNLGLDESRRYSLLGGDVIDISTSNFAASAVGAFTPGRVRITFDMTINNRLDGIRLITPTFPTPPAGVVGLQAFPFEISVTTTSGGVTSGGNEIVVESPRFGAVTASDNWDGGFHNFFNDAGCTATANDCFRYESFGTIEPLGSSTTQQVGFDIDPTVGDFRVRIILAADLENGVAPAPGSVTGTVTSPQIGAITGATVNVSGGFSGTTAAGGAYTVAGVATGSRTVSVANLPSGCVAPAAQTVSVASGAATTVDFAVTCAVPTGSIAGTVTSSLGGGLAGVGVVATPTGGAATPASTTGATGAYTIASVPALSATGSLSLINLPANCTNPGPVPYTGFTTAGLTGQDIVVTCTPAPVSYPVTATWSPITSGGATGREVELVLAIDMGSAPGRPDVNGASADDLSSISFSVSGYGTNLNYVSNSGTSAGLPIASVNQVQTGTVNATTLGAVFSLTGSTQTGAFTFIRLRYQIPSGFSGTINPVLAITEATATTSLIDVTSTVSVIAPPALIVP